MPRSKPAPMAEIMTLDLQGEAATSRLGEDLALALKPGDALLLSGDLGAGKTTLARALIRSLAGNDALEVPSPTFTLVQQYEARIPVSHFDLYRISDAAEAAELGLEEALDKGAVIVEWPERAASLMPAHAVSLRLSHSGPNRTVAIEGPPDTMERIARSLAIRAFLSESGLKDAKRRFLLGDASTRAYETVEPGIGEPVSIVMNAPRQPDGPPIRAGKPYSRIAHLSESVTPFVAVGLALRARGFAAPAIHAADEDQGILLIEHLGLAGVLDAAGAPVAGRYIAAAQCLAAIHAQTWDAHMPATGGRVHDMPPYDRDAMRIETDLLIDWYLPNMAGRTFSAAERVAYDAAWNTVLDRLAGCETSIVLRDFHSPNIIWREREKDHGRIGIIDFQDAVMGPAAYDVAAIGFDARVTIPPALEQEIRQAYASARAARGPFDREQFERAYAIMGAQRIAKILGIFVRLDRRDGKPAYLKHLPRMESYFRTALRHPALAEIRAFVDNAGILAAANS